jgi:hypothetical protein
LPLIAHALPCVQLACTQFAAVAGRVQPEQYVTGQDWRTSRSKVIDNAMIG